MGYLSAIAQIVAAVGSAYVASENAPKPGGTTQAVGAQGGKAPSTAESVFAVSTPKKAAAAPQAATPDANPFVAGLLGPLLAGQSQPVGTGTVLRDPVASAAPAPPAQPTPVQKPGLDSILGSLPEAIAAAGPLLANMGQDPRGSTQAIGAQGGGGGGNMVQGLNLPQRQTIAQILASLPRPRYNA